MPHWNDDPLVQSEEHMPDWCMDYITSAHVGRDVYRSGCSCDRMPLTSATSPRDLLDAFRAHMRDEQIRARTLLE
ncbi:hypothetical protein GCM10017559_54670 [Streptosporangium longisporum]|uniref:Uncharacterized protein n=2 Tax=Streptosporangiaceae TaxID=2004 RepID=A0ABP6KUJ2_9ACTN